MVVYSSDGMVETAFALGLIIGFALIAVCAWLILEMRKQQFRRYYFQLDDVMKRDIMDRFDYIRNQYDFLAKTNTTMMKAEYNSMHRFIEMLKRKQLP